jgi:hypothetical protein
VLDFALDTDPDGLGEEDLPLATGSEAPGVERELGIDFASEVLRQFDGPSASAVSPDGQTFAARSVVSDPEALERLPPARAAPAPASTSRARAARASSAST